MRRTVSIRARIDRLETDCRQYGAPKSKLHEDRLAAFSERMSGARKRAGIAERTGPAFDGRHMSVAERLEHVRRRLKEERGQQ